MPDKQDIEAKDWLRLRNLFLEYGFSDEEADWAADNNLDPKGPKAQQVKQILRNRRTKVRTLMRISGFDWNKVVESLDSMRRENALKKGADEMDLFQGESP